MKTTVRNIIEIDEELCNGCGNCILDCAENAIEIVDGKAKVVRESLCDGLGACLSSCPTDALKIVERSAVAYSEEEVREHLAATRPSQTHSQTHTKTHGCGGGHGVADTLACGCPGSMAKSIKAAAAPVVNDGKADNEAVYGPSHWPLKIRLVNPEAPYFKGADLVVAADCAAALSPTFHKEYANGKALIIGCPKFEDTEMFISKLTDIFRSANLKSCTAVRMQVPCCTGITTAVEKAARRAGVEIEINNKIMSI